MNKNHYIASIYIKYSHLRLNHVTETTIKLVVIAGFCCFTTVLVRLVPLQTILLEQCFFFLKLQAGLNFCR